MIVNRWKRLRTLAASALPVCAGVGMARADDGGSAISIGTELSLRSAVLGETRAIQVALPTTCAERHR